MKKFLNEFKEFALKGNIMDLAIGMIIGTAFTTVVTALTSNFIQPILDFVTRAHKDLYTWAEIAAFISAFISAVINFIIIAFVLFLIMRFFNRINDASEKRKHKNDVPAAPTTKVCPFCKSEISIDATRCPHCTSELK
ncbi:MAG: large conductance mechanosensitive channel protein MscL [Clostridia bacterium]|nr:large conductance mechanosensitive channel protein MscL [Clostridia bacterium]